MLQTMFQINMPYTVKKLDSGNYTFLNREYIPLGFSDKVWGQDIQDERDPHEFEITGLTAQNLDTVAIITKNAPSTLEQFWLYDQYPKSNAEYDEYWKRLRTLLQLSHKTVDIY